MAEEKDPAVHIGRVHVAPAVGRTVRSAEHGKQNLPAKGDFITWDVYWERRFRDGDIVVTDPQPGTAVVETPAPPPAPLTPAPTKPTKTDDKGA